MGIYPSIVAVIVRLTPPPHPPRVQQPRFNALSYNLFSNNCNHFTNECAKFLVGAPIPDCTLRASRSC